ncbi:MAG: hypothetical protein IPL34_20470 [Thiofilum sp.]|uniref:hypothetical protein n=1 Tax=Thiofilum sp. TaxID=2212733 RepID=UPI0025F24F2C|nr:hypothetical protein [Thiofilum sp.]MBK8455658.1 hypothetical protein [Thiofilum sp.]
MADLYGTNAAKANEVPLVLIPQGEKDGAMHLAYDEFVLSGAIIGATDVIKLMKLPAGSMIHNVKVIWTDLGTTGAGVLGFADDTDALAPSMDFTSAGQYLADSAVATNVGLFSRLSAEQEVILSMSAASTAVAGSIKVVVEYSKH